jgi:ribonuclease P protein component
LTDSNRFINIHFHIPVYRRNNEKNFPTQQEEKKENPRLSGSDESQRWAAHHQPPQTKGKKKTLRLMEETLSPRERIRKRKDFLLIYKDGKRHRGKVFNLIHLSNNLGFSRIAIVVSRKVGNSVERNKIKRNMRALFRKNKDLLKVHADMIVIPNKGILDISRSGLQQEYLAAIASVNQSGKAK